MIYDLPTSLEVNGRMWEIRTDYRIVLSILTAFEDPNLGDAEKAFVCLHNLYVDFADMPKTDYQAAYDAASWYIDCGRENDGQIGPRTMDWEQDAPLLFPAVNKVAGFEVRGVEYLHWWTFSGFFMEIGEGVYATVLSLRQKKAKGKKLEKYEREYWAENKRICLLRSKLTEEEQAEKERLKVLLG